MQKHFGAQTASRQHLERTAQHVSLYRCSADGHSDPRAAYGELITQEEKINDFQRKENRDHAGIWP